jgi:hypothetical protein
VHFCVGFCFVLGLGGKEERGEVWEEKWEEGGDFPTFFGRVFW